MTEQERDIVRATILGLGDIDTNLAQAYYRLTSELHADGTWSKGCHSKALDIARDALEKLLDDSKPTVPEPEFKVGDKVMVNPRCGKEIDKESFNPDGDMEITIGEKGVVSYINEWGRLRVRFEPHISKCTWSYSDYQLIKLPE